MTQADVAEPRYLEVTVMLQASQEDLLVSTICILNGQAAVNEYRTEVSVHVASAQIRAPCRDVRAVDIFSVQGGNAFTIALKIAATSD